MIHIVNEENRTQYRHALMEMHRQRKAVFIDEMGWALSAPEGLEIDQFDSQDTTYLVDASAPGGALAASVRLLRTDRPHLLGDKFAHLCPHGVPRSASIWEASRFCPAPQTPKGQRRRDCLALMIAGIMETALLFGVEQVTFVASAALAPVALRVGWRAAPLGPSVRTGRDRLTAIAADIDPEGLRRLRALNGLSGPVTRFIPGDIKRAA